MPAFIRPHAKVLKQRLAEPRQTGKTRLVQSVIESSSTPCRYANADEPTLRERTWIAEHWHAARHIIDVLIKTTLSRADRAWWGRMVESAVGAHLANAAAAGACELFYWRERNREVDFVARAGRVVTAIEVKSGRAGETQPGMDAFAEAFMPRRRLLVGGDGIAVEEFLSRPVEHWIGG